MVGFERYRALESHLKPSSAKGKTSRFQRIAKVIEGCGSICRLQLDQALLPLLGTKTLIFTASASLEESIFYATGAVGQHYDLCLRVTSANGTGNFRC